jgi:hypothetical protein
MALVKPHLPYSAGAGSRRNLRAVLQGSSVDWVPLIAIPVSLALWQWSIRNLDLRRMNDLGLASVLRPSFLAALVILSASMAIALTRSHTQQSVLLIHVLALIVILYGSVPLLVSVPQGTAAYRHLGVADYVTHHGSVDRGIDAYFNWPGFFVMTSALTSMTGFSSALAVARWAPLFFNLLYLLPLALFFRTSCRTRTYTWLCIWLFYCSNWIEQDFYSPQGFAYLGYLCIVATVVALYRRRPPDGEKSSANAQQRPAIFVLLVLAYISVAISHQLTPYAIMLALAALVVTRSTTLFALPMLMCVVAVTWFAYSAVPFFEQFLRHEGRNVGAVSENVSSGLGARLAGSAQHLFIVDSRVAFTLVLWSLALIGIWLRRRDRQSIAAYVGLAASSIALVGLQSYGGEILLRIYLFSLPAVILFVAALPVLGLSRASGLARGVSIGSLSLVLLSLFVFARYGNARLDYFSPQEVAAVQHMYRTAPRGSLIIAGSENLPWRLRGYIDYDYTTVDRLNNWRGGSTDRRSVRRVVAELEKRMADAHKPAYLIFARSMEPWEEFIDLRRRGELAHVERIVAHSNAFHRIYVNEDASIYVLQQRALR